jgi:hypothetical protein
MTMPIRMFLTLLLMFSAAADVFGQTTPASTPATTPATTTTIAREEAGALPTHGSNEVRQDFNEVLRQHPPELATILTLDPTLLSNEAFLTGYPQLARFVSEHPEVRRSPRYYLSDFELPAQRSGMIQDLFKSFAVLLTFLFIALALGWFIRTLIEQRRWSRLSQTQSEVHNKILDRFGSSEELMAYIRTPAGTKFLESAPIPLHAGPTPNAPLSRILWSIQLGIVVVSGALGLIWVSGRFDKETAEGMFAMGAIGVALGAGFIVSALISLAVSRKLGLWQGPGEPADAAALRES